MHKKGFAFLITNNLIGFHSSFSALHFNWKYFYNFFDNIYILPEFLILLIEVWHIKGQQQGQHME